MHSLFSPLPSPCNSILPPLTYSPPIFLSSISTSSPYLHVFLSSSSAILFPPLPHPKHIFLSNCVSFFSLPSTVSPSNSSSFSSYSSTSLYSSSSFTPSFLILSPSSRLHSFLNPILLLPPAPCSISTLPLAPLKTRKRALIPAARHQEVALLPPTMSVYFFTRLVNGAKIREMTGCGGEERLRGGKMEEWR